MATQRERRDSIMAKQTDVAFYDSLRQLTEQIGWREFVKAVGVYRRARMEELVKVPGADASDIAYTRGIVEVCDHIMASPKEWETKRIQLEHDISRLKAQHQASDDGALVYGKAIGGAEPLAALARHLPDNQGR